MSDIFSVTASYDKPSYNVGDTITVTISGGAIKPPSHKKVSVVIDTSKSIIDSSPTPHIWIVSANKLSASTIA